VFDRDRVGEALALAFRETAPRNAALPVDVVAWMRRGEPFIAMEPLEGRLTVILR
jgi:hypothetical protein